MIRPVGGRHGGSGRDCNDWMMICMRYFGEGEEDRSHS